MIEVLSVQVGLPASFVEVDPRDEKPRSWHTGIYKSPVEGRVLVGFENLAGDGQQELAFHGGRDRAVLMFALPNYERLDVSYEPGSFGENLTIIGADEESVSIGDRFTCGELLLEVSQPRLPCYKLGRRLGRPEIVAEVLAARAGGWYLRVLQLGDVGKEDRFERVEHPHPEWTVARAIEVFKTNDEPARSELRHLPAISALWIEKLSRPGKR